jgi:hypothetical protein
MRLSKSKSASGVSPSAATCNSQKANAGQGQPARLGDEVESEVVNHAARVDGYAAGKPPRRARGERELGELEMVCGPSLLRSPQAELPVPSPGKSTPRIDVLAPGVVIQLWANWGPKGSHTKQGGGDPNGCRNGGLSDTTRTNPMLRISRASVVIVKE